MLGLGLGMLGLSQRGYIPNLLSVTLANWLIFLGFAWAVGSLRDFLGLPRRDRVAMALVIVSAPVLFVLTEPWPHSVVRGIFVALTLGAVAGRAAWLLRRHAPEDSRRACRFVEIVLWALVVTTVGRAIGTAVSGSGEVLSHDPSNALSLLGFLGFLVVLTLGVMWMEIETLQRQLLRSARFDALTGLYNRQSFLTEFERELDAASAGTRHEFSVVIFDLDDFKHINDHHGHLLGDRVLSGFAAELRRGVRAGDALGRYGGEEFAVLLPHTSKGVAIDVADRFRASLAEHGVSIDAPSAI
jgi:diguanylate cyclase (GGDEF)-like protein